MDKRHPEDIKGAHPTGSWIQKICDFVTENLDLENIEKFSLRPFFAGVLKKRNSGDAETLFSIGTKNTTPKLHEQMGIFPSPWVFSRAFGGVLVICLFFYYIGFEIGLMITGTVLMPLSVLILFFEINTPKNISVTKLIQLFFIGGALSIVITLMFPGRYTVFNLFDYSGAALIEEPAKLLAAVLAMKLFSIEKDSYILNFLLIGAAVGTGFSVFESTQYAAYNFEMLYEIVILRGLLSPFMHIAWTAIVVTIFCIERKNNSNFYSAVTSKRFIKVLGCVVGLHFIWNLPFDSIILALLLGAIAWIIIISLIQAGLKEIEQLTTNEQNL